MDGRLNPHAWQLDKQGINRNNNNGAEDDTTGGYSMSFVQLSMKRNFNTSPFRMDFDEDNQENGSLNQATKKHKPNQTKKAPAKKKDDK